MKKTENLKELLDELVLRYEVEDFIKNDPIQFPHRFKNKADIEISALVATSFAYGNRKHIIEMVEKLHQVMDNAPLEFCLDYSIEKGEKLFSGMNYRYTKAEDIVAFFHCISESFKNYKSLEDMFSQYYKSDDEDIKNALIGFSGEMKSFYHEPIRGLSFLLPSPINNSACKRLNLFLKWMVRKSPVDLGIWESVSSSKLIIPLDTHVARLSAKFGINDRKTNDWQKAQMITDVLRQFCPEDPVKYDFALFGYGVENRKKA